MEHILLKKSTVDQVIDSRLGYYEISRHTYNSDVDYSVYYSPTLNAVLNHVTPTNILEPYF